MSAQIAVDLRAAAEVLERDGWCRDNYTDDDGCHCVMGALFAVHGDPYAESESVNDHLDSHRDLLYQVLGRNPVSWNDHVARVAAEVIAALRAAADAAEATS